MQKILMAIIFIAGAIFLFGCLQPNAQAPQIGNANLVSNENMQKISLRALNTGFYDKLEIRVKTGQPVELSFSADADSGCGRGLLMPAFGVNLLSMKGETKTAAFLPKEAGVYPYHCSMRMFNGKLIVEK